MRDVRSTCTPRSEILAGTFNPEIFTASLSRVLSDYAKGGARAGAASLYSDSRARHVERGSLHGESVRARLPVLRRMLEAVKDDQGIRSASSASCPPRGSGRPTATCRWTRRRALAWRASSACRMPAGQAQGRRPHRAHRPARGHALARRGGVLAGQCHGGRSRAAQLGLQRAAAHAMRRSRR